jgi:hypothetical protein
MPPARGLYQQVQVLEIVVVLGEHQQMLLNRMHEVARIGDAGEVHPPG